MKTFAAATLAAFASAQDLASLMNSAMDVAGASAGALVDAAGDAAGAIANAGAQIYSDSEVSSYNMIADKLDVETMTQCRLADADCHWHVTMNLADAAAAIAGVSYVYAKMTHGDNTKMNAIAFDSQTNW